MSIRLRPKQAQRFAKAMSNVNEGSHVVVTQAKDTGTVLIAASSGQVWLVGPKGGLR